MTIDQPRPLLSPGAREVLRVLRMFGAEPGQPVRQFLLENLLGRHSGRANPPDLKAVITELVGAGLLSRGRPDGVMVTEETLKSR